MATVSKWTPFGVALDITATAGTVTRVSATTYTVVLNVSWETYYSGAQTNYGMSATSGGVTKTISSFGTKRSSGSGYFTGTYSISGNGAATKTITVTFKNFNTDNGNNASKNVTLSVSVPALPSWTIAYNANGGSNAPSSQTKWKDQSLTLSSTKPTRTGYTFKGWATSASGAVAYASGASYTANAAATLYAVWQANTYTVNYDANGGTGAPASQTKTYGTALKLSSTIPTRTNYNFLGWGTSASSTAATYAAGGSYTSNAAATLYAVWELAYIKPIIYNFSVSHCDYEGNEIEEGLYCLVKYDWETTNAGSTHIISVDPSPVGEVEPIILTKTARSGSESVVLHKFAPVEVDKSYKITVLISDGGGSSTFSTTLNGTTFPFDAVMTDEGSGAAVGKPAELPGVFDVAFDAKFNKPVYGNVLGLNKLPAIPEGANLDDYKTTGAWAIYGNDEAATITCGGVLLGANDSVPPAKAGRFEVNSATGEGIRAEGWSYLRQRFIPYNADNPIWERDIARDKDNIWHFYKWWRSNLTPNASGKIFNKSAITVCLTANITELTTGAYTKIAFNKTLSTMGKKLSLSDNSILIGEGVDYVKASAQILLKCLARGSKHFKINKVSNGTTTSFSWICQETDPITNTAGTVQATGVEFCMTPIIIPVKKGDLITCTYFTSNATDYIVSGTTAGGAQTYFTVEEL